MRKMKRCFIAERAFVCAEKSLLKPQIYHPRSVCKLCLRADRIAALRQPMSAPLFRRKQGWNRGANFASPLIWGEAFFIPSACFYVVIV